MDFCSVAHGLVLTPSRLVCGFAPWAGTSVVPIGLSKASCLIPGVAPASTPSGPVGSKGTVEP
eukprot:11207987-Heterocapsa_arctica.AAC.1